VRYGLEKKERKREREREKERKDKKERKKELERERERASLCLELLQLLLLGPQAGKSYGDMATQLLSLMQTDGSETQLEFDVSWVSLRFW
jgi:hypothetical protein